MLVPRCNNRDEHSGLEDALWEDERSRARCQGIGRRRLTALQGPAPLTFY
jgi:hypothetical protein